MIDNVLGRPSNNLRRIEVLSLLSASLYLLIYRKSPLPRLSAALDRLVARLEPWRIILGTLSTTYLLKHSALLLGLNEPQPMARMYTRNFYRATWILTALDAGIGTRSPSHPLRLLFGNAHKARLSQAHLVCRILRILSLSL